MPADVGGEVRLAGVGFAYPGAEDRAVSDLDLELSPHEIVALVGPSGAGKTTVVNLLMRFFEPHEGRITLDGIDVARYSVADYRRRISLVDQESWLLSGSVRDNITFGRPDASDDEVREAARLAHAHDFIEQLPGGYDTLLSEAGRTLSAGQRQRIALARALVRKPVLLILDEATSHLDGQSEAIILEVLQALRGRCTVLVVGHREAVVRAADRVVRIDDGKPVANLSSREFLGDPALAATLSRAGSPPGSDADGEGG